MRSRPRQHPHDQRAAGGGFFPSLGTHFNARIDGATLAQIRAFGFRWARMDCQTCAIETMLDMVFDCQVAELHPLPIVYDLDRLDALPPGDAEWGNEPDGDIHPNSYRVALDDACVLAASRGIQLWAPAISNLDRDSLRWLEAVRGAGWPAELHGISVHRYGDGTFEFAHDGFASRDDEVRRLLELCDGLPFIVTEFGYPTDAVTRARRGKREKFLQVGLQLSEEQAAANITKEWEFWRKYTDKPFLYQINDGPNEGETYGIRRCLPDGTLTDWKPAAYQVPQEAEHTMKIAITNATLFGPLPITDWLTAEYDGTSVKLTRPLPGGAYLSIPPGSFYEGKPNVAGVYEMFQKNGNDLVCAYTHEGVDYVHVVPFKELVS